MAKPNMEDMKAMYQHSLLLIKNTPVFVDVIYGTEKVGGLNLNTQRKETFDLASHTDMKAPGRSFGFINQGGVVGYVTRMPVRNGGRPSVGMSKNNMTIFYPEGHANSRLDDNVYRLTAPELADAVKGRYPNISEAWERVKNKAERIVAFDRQFAIDYNGNVFFKTTKVGKAKAPKNVYEIEFNEGFKYLITLLDNNHEKIA